MLITSSTYWNEVNGFTAEDVEKDLEGLQTKAALEILSIANPDKVGTYAAFGDTSQINACLTSSNLKVCRP